MKVLCIIATLLVSLVSSGQKVFSSNELQTAQSASGFNFKGSTLTQTAIYNGFLSLTDKKGVGFWISPYVYFEGFDLPIGILYSNENTARNVFREFGLGIGPSSYKKWLTVSSEAYAYFENRSNTDRCPGKITLSLNPSFNFEYKELWVNAWGTIGITKWLYAGARYQSDGGQGGYIVLRPSNRFSIGAVAGKQSAVLLRLDFQN